jgi:hypothetical protein
MWVFRLPRLLDGFNPFRLFHAVVVKVLNRYEGLYPQDYLADLKEGVELRLLNGESRSLQNRLVRTR